MCSGEGEKMGKRDWEFGEKGLRSQEKRLALSCRLWEPRSGKCLELWKYYGELL